MLTLDFIRDLFDNKICHTKHYSNPELILLLWIDLFGMKRFINSSIWVYDRSKLDDIHNHTNSYNSIQSFLQSIHTDIMRQVQSFMKRKEGDFSNFYKKYKDSTLSLAVPILDGSNKLHRVYIIDGIYKVSRLTLAYNSDTGEYGTCKHNITLYYGRKYMLIHRNILNFRVLQFSLYSHLYDHTTSADAIFDITTIPNFDIDKFKKIYINNKPLALSLYKKYLVHVK